MSKDELIQKLLTSVGRVKKYLDQAAASGMEDRMATMLQMQALHYLQDNPNITVGEFASHLSMSSSAITQFTDRLIANKLIERKDDESDRRIVRLIISKAGKSELQKLQTAMSVTFGQVFSQLSEEDLQDMIDIHERLLAKLDGK